MLEHGFQFGAVERHVPDNALRADDQRDISRRGDQRRGSLGVEVS